MKLYDVPQIDGQLYLRDETDLWGFIQNGKYEPEETELIKKLVKSNDVCLDIGANIGYYTVLMAKQGGFVWAFEPEPTNYQLLIDNIVVNEVKHKTFPLMYAVSNVDDVLPLYLCDKSHGMHRMFKSKHCNKERLVKTMIIDDEFREIEPDFIKIDVEGAELDVLLGTQQMIMDHRPTMVIEFHPPTFEEKGDNPKLIYNHLVALGYDIRLVPNIDESISYEDLYDKTNNESGGQNILCLKK